MPPSTIINEVAPPGGCRQRSTSISAMALPTASAAAISAEPRRCTPCTPAMPTSADNVLPPTTAQGCAIGPAGSANTSTALAPRGAISQGRRSKTGPPNRWHSRPVRKMPMSAPANMRNPSRWSIPVRAGMKARHQAELAKTEKRPRGGAAKVGKGSRAIEK